MCANVTVTCRFRYHCFVSLAPGRETEGGMLPKKLGCHKQTPKKLKRKHSKEKMAPLSDFVVAIMPKKMQTTCPEIEKRKIENPP